MHQRYQDPVAGGADGVIEGSSAAVDVDPSFILFQYPASRDCLNGKGLIDFDRIDVIQPSIGPF